MRLSQLILISMLEFIKKDVMQLGKIQISEMYAYIHNILCADAEILGMLGLTANSSVEELDKQIQKRKTPHILMLDHHPLITFYKNRGERGQNYLEYYCTVNFDVYTQDNVELALRIADRIVQLFDGNWPRNQRNGLALKGEYVTSTEDDTTLKDCYKYSTQIGFTIELDEN